MGLPLLLLAAGLSAMSRPLRAAEVSWRDRLASADRLRAEGKVLEAAALARGVLAEAEKEVGPDGPEIEGVLATLARVDNEANVVEELPELEKRLAAVPSKDFRIWSALGTVLRDQGKSAEAEASLKKALALKPGDPEAEFELSRAYDDMGRFEEELPLLERRSAADPGSYFLASRLARAYLRLGRVREAKETFARAKRAGARASEAYIAEGYFDTQAGRPDDARTAFENAVAADTASAAGYHHLGAYYVAQGRYAEGEKYLRRALALLEADPNASTNDLLHTMQWLGDALVANGRDDEAEALLLKSLEKAPPGGDRQLWSLRTLARLYASQGKTDREEAALERAADACSTKSRCGSLVYGGEALIDLGKLDLARGRKDKAAAMAARAEELADAAPIGQSLALFRDLASFDAELGDDARREALFARLLPARRSMPFNPELVWVEIGSAGISASHGRLKESEALYRRALDVIERTGDRMDEASALEGLAAVYAKQGKTDLERKTRARVEAAKSSKADARAAL